MKIKCIRTTPNQPDPDTSGQVIFDANRSIDN